MYKHTQIFSKHRTRTPSIHPNFTDWCTASSSPKSFFYPKYSDYIANEFSALHEANMFLFVILKHAA